MKYSWLPPTLQEIAEHAGLEAALKLAEVKGGQRVHIPHRVTARHWLARAIGVEAAATVCSRYAGLNIVVPIGPHGGVNKMRHLAERAIADGVSANEAARRSGLHVRNIYRRKARRRDETAGPTLFDAPSDRRLKP